MRAGQGPVASSSTLSVIPANRRRVRWQEYRQLNGVRTITDKPPDSSWFPRFHRLQKSASPGVTAVPQRSS